MSANAAPIGLFSWNYDALFGSGSVFGVANESFDPFEDTFIDLFAPGATTSFVTLSLGDIDAGLSVQSIDDLSLLLVPDDLDRAILRMSYTGSNVTATLLASSLTGEFARVTSTVIDDASTASVPEPSTLVLLGLGFLGAVRRRRQARA
jgi:hypothetical protein